MFHLCGTLSFLKHCHLMYILYSQNPCEEASIPLPSMWSTKKERVWIPVSNLFTSMGFLKPRAVEIIPSLRMGLYIHSYFARNNVDTPSAVTGLLVKVSTSVFSWRFLGEIFLYTVANAFTYSLRNIFIFALWFWHPIPPPCSSTQKTVF